VHVPQSDFLKSHFNIILNSTPFTNYTQQHTLLLVINGRKNIEFDW
jgi:hypothetical protein